jgi:colicin import membrane protein
MLNLKNILLPLMLIFGLAGYAGVTFAANSGTHAKKEHHHKAKKDTHEHKHKHKAKKDAHEHKHKKAKAEKAHKKHDKKHHDKVVGKRKDGKAIYQGPKGGKYYINDAGNKVYLSR